MGGWIRRLRSGAVAKSALVALSVALFAAPTACSDDDGGSGSESSADTGEGGAPDTSGEAGSDTDQEGGPEEGGPEEGGPEEGGPEEGGPEEGGPEEGGPEEGGPEEGGPEEGGPEEGGPEEGGPEEGGPEGGEEEGGPEGGEEEGGPGPGDGSACSELAMCALACGFEDEPCVTACLGAYGPSTQGLFQPLMMCVTESCMEAADVTACATESCGEYVASCFAPEASCKSLFFCELSCLDSACVQGCFEGQAGGGKDKYDAMYGCFDANCTKPITTDCMVERIKSNGPCAAQANACLPVSGAVTCQQIMATCLLPNCGPDDIECVNSCLEQGRVIDQIVGPPFMACLAENCEYGPDGYDEACVIAAQNNFCSSQWTACFSQL